LHANAITIPSRSTERLCDAARAAGVVVAIGVNERNAEASDSTLFNTLLYIGPDAAILGKHRKLVPTGGERLVWGRGDGSDLEVYRLPFGRVSGLICWENYMPLARYALAAWGAQIHVAPTWDRGEPWMSTMRHIAKEGRAVVIGCCQAVRKDDIPDDLSFKAKYLLCHRGLDQSWRQRHCRSRRQDHGPDPPANSRRFLYANVRQEQLVGSPVAARYCGPLRQAGCLRTHRASTTDTGKFGPRRIKALRTSAEQERDCT